MLYVIYGNNRDQGLKHAQVLRDGFLNKGAVLEVVEEEKISDEWLEEALSSAGLFGERSIFVLQGVLEKKENQDIFISKKENLKNSGNVFLILEPSFSKKTAEEFEGCAEEVKEFAVSKNEDKPEFNIFSLGDALGGRNKKELWILYQRAVVAGLRDEEISGTLFWSIKNIALIKSVDGKTDAGINPYVAKKARLFAKNYTNDEIKNISQTLSRAYHEAHRGGEPMGIALEKFILSL